MQTPSASGAEPRAPGDPEIAALRAGDERAFLALVTRHHATLVRVARAYVRSEALAEEVAQDTWLAVLRSLDRYEGRAPLRAWILGILVNCARTRGAREARSVPFSALEPEGRDGGDGGPAVPEARFRESSHRWAGHWSDGPAPWPDEVVASGELRRLVGEALETLPPSQRAVVALRDVEGLESEDVCAALGISEGNQRVLLHRGRAKVRAWVEERVRERVG
jgi:RNA polymerase sigma-70 factor (ECF subfamily)